MAYLTIEKDGPVAVVWLDQPGEKVNKLADYVLAEFTAMFDELESDLHIRAVVLISRKKDTFIAGADLDRLGQLMEPGKIEELSRAGHALFKRLENFPKPVVAAINGAALGGGLEVALACHYRLASDSPKTVLGLPEVKLGLLPAGGGTQRLPRLIGIQRALDLLLTGKNVYPIPARRMGLVDEVVNPFILLEAAKKTALDLAIKPPQRRVKQGLAARVLEKTPLRRLIFHQAHKMVQRQTRGNYPAPLAIIDCVQTGMRSGREAGLAAEAKAFEALAHTPQSRQLVNLFFGVNAGKKNPSGELAKPLDRLAVLGAGLMGSGIANVSINKDINVVLKDLQLTGVAAGMQMIWNDLNRRVQKRALSSFERDRQMSRVTGQTDYSGFATVKLVIEAVFEDLAIKHRVLSEVEAVTPDDCIFASNTSSLPIRDIAAAARRPQQVIGMHYFSPVPRMPLLEVIVTPQTGDWVTATVVDIGIRQGKTVIVVQDGPGFYTTRILAPMLNEALLLLSEGGEVRHIDSAMRAFGFPVGPFTLIDEVGIDVGAHVSAVLGRLFEQRGSKPSDMMARMLEDGFKGRKNLKGFYHYDEANGKPQKRREVNQTIYKYAGGFKRSGQAASDIQQRLLLMMVNEALLCLQEGILSSPLDGDLGAVLGLGFPPFLGGPFRYVDSAGPAAVLAQMEDYQQRFGARFAPAGLLRDHARRNQLFYT